MSSMQIASGHGGGGSAAMHRSFDAGELWAQRSGDVRGGVQRQQQRCARGVRAHAGVYSAMAAPCGCSCCDVRSFCEELSARYSGSTAEPSRAAPAHRVIQRRHTPRSLASRRRQPQASDRPASFASSVCATGFLSPLCARRSPLSHSSRE